MTEPHNSWSPLKTVASMVIGAVLGASVYVVAEIRHSAQHAEHVPPPPAAETLLLAKAPEEPEQPRAAAETAPPPAAAKEAPEPALTAEQALLEEARTQLESNKAAAAQATLERMKKRFARGNLVQERELLRIEVYKARGQLAAAKRAARKFAKAFPDSPHLDELAALTKI